MPLAQLKQTKQPASNPLSRKRSRQQILEEEQAFDDSAWPSDDDYSREEEAPAATGTGGSVVAEKGTKKRKSTGNDGALDLEQQCLVELQSLQSKVRLLRSRSLNCFKLPLSCPTPQTAHASQRDFALSDELLQMLAAIMPTSELNYSAPHLTNLKLQT